ncbi:NAD(P)-dependent oxidoreductase [Demequina sp. SO4-13]|uniref:NAD(P)-dependent oxidoreductase n=1 Tax=Demequina sp. SO4-13 TaxID=3401027 RepID=UPI003AF42861
MTEYNTVAVFGLGAMGLPMATALGRHGEVSGFDPYPARRELARDHGIKVYDTAAQCAATADVAVLAVRDEAQLETVMFGDDGIVPHLRQGIPIVLTSTVGADAVRELTSRLDEHGLQLVDAPVSGGPVRAESGDLLVLVAASPQAWEAARPAVEAMGSTVTMVSERPGDGQALKTVNQLLCGIHIAAAAEAMALARALGLDLQAVLDALGAGAARSFMLSDRGGRMLEWERGETPEVFSTIGIFVKDMGIVGDATRSTHVATPVAAAAEHLFRVAERLGLENDDDSAVLRAIADLGERDSTRA